MVIKSVYHAKLTEYVFGAEGAEFSELVVGVEQGDTAHCRHDDSVRAEILLPERGQGVMARALWHV